MALRFLNSGYFAGKVGIGTDSPGAVLSVRNPTAGTSAFSLQHSTTSSIFDFQTGIANVTGDALVIKDVANSYDYLTLRGGNVGIGTSSPSARLQVYDDRDITSNPTNKGIRLQESTGDWLLSLGISSVTNTGFAIRDNVTSAYPFVIRETTGNVGIGTTGPSARLEVSDNNTTKTAIHIDNTSTGGHRWDIASIGSAVSGRVGNLQIRNDSDALNIVEITGAGNVGIGTTAPTAPLHFGKTVYGDPSSENFFRIKFNDVGGVMNDVGIGQPNASSIGWNITPSANGVFEWNAGTEGRVMNLTNAGVLTLDSYDSTNNTGTPTYLLGTDASGNVVKTNTVPGSAAGPYLPLAGGTMTAGAVVTFLASSGSTDDRLKFGASGQMQLFHDGSDGYIINSLGDVRMDVNTFRVRSSSGTETMIKATQNDNVELYFNDVRKIRTTSGGVFVEGEIKIDSALLDNQANTDVDTGTETVASVAIATYTAAFFDFVIKKGLNVRSGTVYACHDGDTTPLVAFTETSTQDLGDTSDVTLSVDISGGNMRLRATTTSDDWSVKSLIRAI